MRTQTGFGFNPWGKTWVRLGLMGSIAPRKTPIHPFVLPCRHDNTSACEGAKQPKSKTGTHSHHHGTPYWNPDDVVSIQVNGQTIYSASRTGGVTINQLPFRPYFRVQFRSLMFHFRWSLDILGWFIRKCLQCPHWRHHQVTSPFAD